MARQLVAEFFPFTDGLLTSRAPGLYDVLLPPADPPPTLCGGHVRWASLLPLCCIGVAVGARGIARCRTRQHSGQSSMHAYRSAFAYYAAMNVVAALCHCLTEPGSPVHRVAAGLDVGFTCASSLCLCLAALMRPASPPVAAALRSAVATVPPAALAVALAGNWWIAGSSGIMRSPPLLNETLYIGATLLAAATLTLLELARPGLPQQAQRSITMAAAAFMAVLPLGATTPRLNSALRLPAALKLDPVHVLFAGCSVSFWCLSDFLAALESDAAASSSRFIKPGLRRGGHHCAS